MSWCLTKDNSRKFKEALKNGELDPFKLSDMESIKRRELFAKYVGVENAREVNALFESKLILKNQKAGFISWAKRTAGITAPIKRDMLSTIERLDTVLNPKEEQQFLQDLASKRLRLDVTQTEAKTISDLSNKVSELRTKANNEGIFTNEKDRFEYGAAKVSLEKYVNELKLQSKRIFFREQPVQKVLSVAKEIPGAMKSIVASLDNSLWGRQGIKTLLDVRTSKIWTKNFLKSWADIGKELAGVDAMDLVKADIYSRPNALNGKYDAGGYGLTALTEEAFPSALPEKIPLFGRLFKASESAYNGGALRLRADLADRLIKIAEKQGINTLDKTEARGMGHLISSMTGRGSLGKADTISKEINTFLFSIKFLKSNFDTLTAHQFDSGATSFVKKEAAKNLLSITASVASILFIAKLLNKDSVDDDPRSTNFGKVKIFGHWTDITGGMASLITLSSRLVPTYHNGELGFWSKSSTGKYNNLSSGKYGQMTPLDVFENFWEGKLSPFAGIVRDIWQGKDYQGQPVTLQGEIGKTLTPISIQNFQQLKEDPNSSSVLGSMILDGLGLSTSTYTYKSDWSTSTSKELIQFRNKIGEDKFKEANDAYNRSYSVWFNNVSTNNQFKKLSDVAKESLITKAKAKIKEDVFRAYNFKYKKPKKNTYEEKQQKNVIKKLLPN